MQNSPIQLQNLPSKSLYVCAQSQLMSWIRTIRREPPVVHLCHFALRDGGLSYYLQRSTVSSLYWVWLPRESYFQTNEYVSNKWVIINNIFLSQRVTNKLRTKGRLPTLHTPSGCRFYVSSSFSTSFTYRLLRQQILSASIWIAVQKDCRRTMTQHYAYKHTSIQLKQSSQHQYEVSYRG